MLYFVSQLLAELAQSPAYYHTHYEALLMDLAQHQNKEYISLKEISIRQDITVKMLDQAVISDAAGKVIFNLAQQDAKALRIVFRVGYQAIMPVNHQQTDAAKASGRADQQWSQYQKAYEMLLAATHTPWAPWTIVPADSKTHRNLMIATVLREVLSNLELKYPPGAPALEKIKVK